MTTATMTTAHRTRDGHDACTLIGHVVRCPALGLFGIAEYLTSDGWFGIRQPGGGLDEVQAGRCEVDPT